MVFQLEIQLFFWPYVLKYMLFWPYDSKSGGFPRIGRKDFKGKDSQNRSMKNEIANTEISNKIYAIRGQQVMLDEDLAELYQVNLSILNRAAKRNIERFPQEFMFQLTDEEWNSLRCQIGILNIGGLRPQNGNLDSNRLRPQFATLKNMLHPMITET